jgi:hypothetical protein
MTVLSLFRFLFLFLLKIIKMPDKGQYDDSLLLRLSRLPMVRITHKIHILFNLCQYNLDTVFCIVLCFFIKGTA